MNVWPWATLLHLANGLHILWAWIQGLKENRDREHSGAPGFLGTCQDQYAVLVSGLLAFRPVGDLRTPSVFSLDQIRKMGQSLP
jgi:hypothetical protein